MTKGSSALQSLTVGSTQRCWHLAFLSHTSGCCQLCIAGMQAVALVNASFFTGTLNQVNVTDKPITFNATFATCSAQIQSAVSAFLKPVTFGC